MAPTPMHTDRQGTESHDLRHHGDAEVRDDGARLTDLAVNVRADTPPAWLRERIAASLTGLAAYPDGRDARAAVAARHGLPADRVLLTAGAAEAFVLLARALTTRRPLVVHPQFTEPEAALRDAGHTVDRLLLREEDGFRLDPEAVPADADLVVIGNPTNPTSVLHPADTIAQLARPGRTLVVDEAFMDAVPGEREALAGRTDVPGLVVLRSLTKTWGLAGLRIGYVLAAPETIAELERAQPLWPVSTPALAAAQACVESQALAEAAHAAHRIAADRAHLVAGLREFAPDGLMVAEPAEGPSSSYGCLVRPPYDGICATSVSRSGAGTRSRAWTRSGCGWRCGTGRRSTRSSRRWIRRWSWRSTDPLPGSVREADVEGTLGVDGDARAGGAGVALGQDDEGDQERAGAFEDRCRGVASVGVGVEGAYDRALGVAPAVQADEGAGEAVGAAGEGAAGTGLRVGR